MTAPHEPNGRRANDNAPEVTSGEAPAGGDQRARFKEPTPPAPVPERRPHAPRTKASDPTPTLQTPPGAAPAEAGSAGSAGSAAESAGASATGAAGSAVGTSGTGGTGGVGEAGQPGNTSAATNGSAASSASGPTRGSGAHPDRAHAAAAESLAGSSEAGPVAVSATASSGPNTTGGRTATATHRHKVGGDNDRMAIETDANTAHTTAATEDTSATTGPAESDRDVVRAGGSMAIATLTSRVTGFLRNLMIGASMGAGVASAFTSANTLPALITEIVLGAVLTALVVPVLVRAEQEDPDNGAAFVRRLLTVSVTILLAVTVIAVFCAPWLVQLSLDPDGKVNVNMAAAFAYLLLPQILFSGLFALLMAILNTKGIYRPGAWAPVINNLIMLTTLVIYWTLPNPLDPQQQVSLMNPHLLLLGAGATTGMFVQAAILVPFLRRAKVDLRPLWGIDDRIKQFAGMGVAIIIYVAISQGGFFFTNRIASNADDAALFIYQQHWLLLQVPYGVIGVTLLTAIMPRLSRNAARGDNEAVVGDLALATKLTLLALIPIILYFTIFGTTISRALFAWGRFDNAEATILGWTLSFGAFTLVPYAIVLLHLRVFYAREQAWTPTFIILGITFTKVVLSYTAPYLATSPRYVVVLLAAANGFGFVSGALVGSFLLHRSLGSLRGRDFLRSMSWIVGASMGGALVAYGGDLLLQQLPNFADGKLGLMVRTAVDGLVLVLVTGIILSRSGLEEVRMIGSLLARIPGLRRLAPAGPAEQLPTTVDSQEVQDVFAVTDLANASPVLPPMAAGTVRGPRLVPGAAIAQGRYRLLADHGGTTAVRFWQAREAATEELVALTIIDPVLLPSVESQAEAMLAGQSIIDRTVALKDVRSAGLAPIRAIIRDSATCIIAANWIPGSSLQSVAEQRPNPLAATYAAAYLMEAVNGAAAEGTAVGIDHRDRLRISTTGEAVVAFPAVLPTTTCQQDIHGVGVALGLLLAEVPEDEIPDSVRAVEREARDAAHCHRETMARRMRRVGLGQDDDPQHSLTAPTVDETPDPEATPGFGEARPRGGLVFISLIVVSVVIALALIAAFLMGELGGHRQGSPLNENSLDKASSSVAHLAPKEVPLKGLTAHYWQPPQGPGTPDNPAQVPAIVDGDATTGWTSDQYRSQLGDGPSALKPGIGLMVELPQSTAISQVRIDGLTPGMVVELRSARTAHPEGLSETQALTTVEASSATVTVPLPEKPQTQYMVLWITRLPLPETATVKEVSVMGVPR